MLEVAVVLAAAVAYVLGSLLWWQDGPAAAPVGDLVMTVVPVGAAVLVLRAARRMDGAPRRAWSLIGASAATWGAGQSLFAWSELVAHQEDPFPGPADVCFVPATLLLAAGLGALPSSPRRTVGRSRTLTDGLIVTTALLLSSWSFLLQPLYAGGSGSALGQVLALYYPAADVVVLAALMGSLGRSQRGGRLSLRLLAAGVVLFAAADSLYVVLSFDGSYHTGMPIDVGWFCGYALCATAARAYRPQPEDDEDRPASVLALAQPYVAAALALLVHAVAASQGRHSAVATVGVVVLMGLVLVRQWLAVRENHALALQLHRLAHVDSLTGLPNRRALDRALERAGERDACLLLLDLNGFKAVNDSYGHPAGDALLVALAERLQRAVRSDDVVARLGGDEFAVLPADGAQGDSSRLVRHLEDVIAQPVRLPDGHVVQVSASIGVARSRAGTSATTLLREADAAMYVAKHAHHSTEPRGSLAGAV